MAQSSGNSGWFYIDGGQQRGPTSDADLRQLAAAGRLQSATLVWREGMAEWMPAGSVPGLLAQSTPPAYGVPPGYPVPPTGFPPQPLGYAAAVPQLGYGYPPPSDIGQSEGMRWLLPVGRSGWAIAAGYLGLLSFVIFPAPLALIISIVAIRDIRKHPNRHGMGRAIFGLIMGILGTIVLGLMLVGGAFASRR